MWDEENEVKWGSRKCSGCSQRHAVVFPSAPDSPEIALFATVECLILLDSQFDSFESELSSAWLLSLCLLLCFPFYSHRLWFYFCQKKKKHLAQENTWLECKQSCPPDRKGLSFCGQQLKSKAGHKGTEQSWFSATGWSLGWILQGLGKDSM